MISLTAEVGIANGIDRHRTTIALTIASVSGSRSVNVDPRPGTLSIWIVPPSEPTLLRTTSMPTPRPETDVVFSAVLKPGRKIRS